VFRSMRRDDGFSVAEVVIASAILFFVITAMLGLVGASQKMSVTAKQRSVGTNSLAWYIDRIRTLPFDQVQIGSGVPAQETLQYGSQSVKFTNRVSFPDGTGKVLRTVTITASYSVRGVNYSQSAVVHLRNPKNNTGATDIRDPNMPVVEFTSSTPPAGSVLFGKWIHPSGLTAVIDAVASSPNDRIVSLKFMVGSTLLRNSAAGSGQDAAWTFAPGEASVSESSDWDTTQSGVQDGVQRVTIIATDDQGRTTTADRDFVVDNLVPGAPGVPVGSSVTSSTAAVVFDPAVDGPGYFASRYTYELYREVAGADAPPASPAWIGAGYGTQDAPGANIAARITNNAPMNMKADTPVPFSRYWARVRGGGPRDWGSDYGLMGDPFISRPELVSTVTNPSTTKTTNGAYESVLWISKPTFPYNASDPESLKYTYWYKDSTVANATWNQLNVTSGNTAIVDNSGMLTKISLRQIYSGPTKTYWYKVGVSVKPSGYNGGTLQGPFFTNAIGLTNKTKNVIVPLNPDTDWSQ